MRGKSEAKNGRAKNGRAKNGEAKNAAGKNAAGKNGRAKNGEAKRSEAGRSEARGGTRRSEAESEAKETALSLSRLYGVPVNLSKLACYLGARIRVIFNQFPSSISGFLYPHPWLACMVIVVNGDMHYYHRRFTIAHELWHILNKQYGGKYRVVFRQFHGENAEDERLANIFATELLMPAHDIKDYYHKGCRKVAEFSRHFKVSEAAIKIRLFRELGFPQKEFIDCGPFF